MPCAWSLAISDCSSEKISSRIFRPSSMRAGIEWSLSLCFGIQMIAREEKRGSNEATMERSNEAGAENLEGTHGNQGGHGVRLSRSESDGVVTDVAGFHADKLAPLAGAQVGHGFRFFGPGIPDNGIAGVFLGDKHAATGCGIFDLNRSQGVAVNAIGFRGEHYVASVMLFALGIGLIEIGDAVQAAQPDGFDVADEEVGMESFFETEG